MSSIIEQIIDRCQSHSLSALDLQVGGDYIHMLDSAVGFTLILLRSFEGVGLEGGAGCGGDRGKELFWSAWLYKQVWKLGSTYSVLGINSRLKIFTLDHHGELLVDGLAWGHESSIQAIERYARKWDEVLDNTLAPN